MRCQQAYIPFFIITWRNLMTTLLEGRINTCRFPLFSALYMVLRASPSTLMRTMMGKCTGDLP